MAFDTATDINVVKRNSQLLLTNYTLGSAPFDHFRFVVFRMNLDGSRTEVFRSDSFTTVTGKTFELAEANDVPNDVIGVDYDTFYQAELQQFDAPELLNDKIDEFFFFTFPNQIATTSDTTGSIDETLFNKLLFQLGHNTTLLEFNNTGGYVSALARRGYASTLSEEIVEGIFDNPNDPDDADVSYKTQLTATTAVDGNQLQSLERESDITP